PVPARLPAPAAPEPPRRRHGVSQVSYRRNQETRRPRPDPLRPGLRPARPRAAGVPAADLPDDPAGPRRLVQGQAGDDRQFLRTVPGRLEPQATRRAAALGHAVPATTV